jgi:hypothetical protein
MARFIRTASAVAAALAVLLVAAAMVAMVVAARAPTAGSAGPAAGLSSRPTGEYDFRGARDLGSATAAPALGVAMPSGITANGRLGGP